MPQCGWVCPLDKAHHAYAYCFGSCANTCLPLPLLMALKAEDRPIVQRQYSVTELIQPPKVVYFKRNASYFQDPRAMLYAIFGTSVHALLEEGASKLKDYGVDPSRYVVEKQFSVEVETDAGMCAMTGKPDAYDTLTKTLIDWKTSSAYPVKLLKEGRWNESAYLPQVNIYRAFFFPEAEHIQLIAFVKDHGRRTRIQDGLEPVEVMEVPILERHSVKEYVRFKLAEHLRAQETGYMRDCTDDERWFRKEPIRCMEYCAAGMLDEKGKPYCSQYNDYLEKQQHDKKKKH